MRTLLRSATFAALAFSAALIPAPSAIAAPGDLDPTFGVGGIARWPLRATDGVGYAIAPYLGGHYFVAGGFRSSETYRGAVASLGTDGTVDFDWGYGGQHVESNMANAYGVHASGNSAILSGTRLDGAYYKFYAVKRDSDGTPGVYGTSSGSITVSFGATSTDYAFGSALQSDGKLVMAGCATTGGVSQVALARLTAGGILDTAFDTDGLVTLDTGAPNECAYAAAIQADGKIVVAGYTDPAGTGNDLFVARLNTNGSLDTGFGTSGIFKANYGAGTGNIAYALALQTDGKIVVAGEISSATNSMAVLRLNTNGTLDATFGVAGKASVEPISGVSRAQAVAMQTDGKIVLAGYTNDGTGQQMRLVRMNANGTLDATFGTSGVARPASGPYGGGLYAINIQPTGAILAAGLTRNVSPTTPEFTAMRFTAAGAVDPTFGFVGQRLLNFSSNSDQLVKAVVRSDGKIVVAATQSTSYVLVSRYNADGTRDAAFTPTYIGNYGTYARAVAIQSDNKIVVTASYPTGGDTHAILARVMPDGGLDATFGTGGIVEQALGQLLNFDAVAVQADGKIVVGGNSFGPTSNDLTFMRYTAIGTVDSSFGAGGVALVNVQAASGTESLRDMAIQPDGKIVGLGEYNNAGYQGVLVRLLSTGAMDTGWGTAGILPIPQITFPEGLTRAADGSYFIAGSEYVAGNPNLGVVKVTAAGVVDTNFGTNGTALVPTLYRGVKALVQSDGKIVVAAGQLITILQFGVARFYPNGQVDPTFAGGGAVTPLPFYSSFEDAALVTGNKLLAMGYTDAAYEMPTFARYDLGPMGPVVSLSATSTSLVYGQSTLLIINFTPNTGPAPTGTVTIRRGTTVLGTATVSGGAASFFASMTHPVGSHVFTAEYSGDAVYGSNASLPLPFTVSKANVNVVITNTTPNPSNPGATATVNYTVTPAIPASGTPTGIVTVDSGNGIGSTCNQNLPNLSCGFVYPTLGAKTVNATYAGDSNFNGASANPHTHNVTDTIAPSTSLTAGPTGNFPSASATFQFTSNEPGTFECKLDAGSFAACTTPKTYNGLAEGAHTFEVRAIDASLNVDATPATRTWTVDTIAPDTTIASGPTGTVASTSAAFTFNSNDGTAGFQCRLDGASFGSCASSVNYSSLAQGSHTFEARAVDPAGNPDPTPASRTWTVDTAPPDTTITGGPTGSTNQTTAAFTFTATEGGSTFECRMDGATFAPCVSPASYPGLDSGAHTFEVRAKDPVNNTDLTPASRSFTVDLTPPDTIINTGPLGLNTSSSASFTFDTTEPGGSFECRMDAGAFTACTSPKAYTGLLDGSHTFQVRAIDAAGNPDPAPASRTWTIDATAPETSILSGPSGTVTETSAAFTFSSNDAGATFQCRLDAALFNTCTSPANFSGLAAGAHTFEVRALDSAGNVDETPAARAWTIGAPPVARRPRDANGDGRSDVFWGDPSGQSALWLMDGGTPIGSALILGPSTGWSMENVTGDFNGDGKSDIVWKHTSGMWAIWLMDGTAPLSYAVILGPSTGWSVTHVGDFDGDGNSDLLWRNVDGSVSMWLMNGLAIANSTILFGPGTPWSVTHVADLDGDARSDLVWRNASDGSVSAWLMNGLSVANSGFVFGGGTTWQVVHTGDFDGNGARDLLFRDAAGQLSIFLMNGLAVANSALIYNGGAFDVTHVADFNGDGKSDLLFKDGGGQVAVWLLDALSVTGSAIVFGGGGGWTVTHTGDYNNDNRADLLWKDSAGQVAIWMLDGTNVIGSALIFGGNGGWVAAP